MLQRTGQGNVGINNQEEDETPTPLSRPEHRLNYCRALWGASQLATGASIVTWRFGASARKFFFPYCVSRQMRQAGADGPRISELLADFVSPYSGILSLHGTIVMRRGASQNKALTQSLRTDLQIIE